MAIAAVVAFSVVPVLELSKWFARRGWLEKNGIVESRAEP